MRSLYDVFYELRKSKKQPDSVAGGVLLMMSSGIHFAYGIFNPKIHHMPWAQGFSHKIILFVIVSWFMGSIIGFISIPKFLQTFRKKTFYFVSNGIIIITSAFLIVMPSDFYVVIFTRFFAGIAHGWTYVTVISHISENTSDTRRGFVAGCNNFFFISGIVLTASISNSFPRTGIDPLRFLAIVMLLFSALAILLTILMYKESPLVLIQGGEDLKAVNTLTYLRGVSFETLQIQEDYNELKVMTIEDNKTTSGLFIEGNLRPLLITLLLKFAFVLSFNYPINMIRFPTSYLAETHGFYGFLFYFFPRLIVALIVVFSIEISRRLHMLTSAAGTSILLVVMGIIKIVNFDNAKDIDLIIIIIYEIIATFGLSIATNVYDAEAFSTPKKMKSIAFTSIIENFIQIILILFAAYMDHTKIYNITVLMSCGFLLAIATICLYITLPETKNLSIRQTRSRFLKT